MNSISNPESKRWSVTCQDASDGSGDLIVPLPPELITEMNLVDGDTLYIVEAYAGNHKSFVLSKTDRVDDIVEHSDSQDLDDIRIAEQRLSDINSGYTRTSNLDEIAEKYQLGVISNNDLGLPKKTQNP